MPNLDNLYLTLVTGSPLSVELSEWFYQKFPRHVATFSSSGGTDLVSASTFYSPSTSLFFFSYHTQTSNTLTRLLEKL